MVKLLCIVGARPNFIKIAPLLKAFRTGSDRISARLVHTGQHYDADMSDVFFQTLQIPNPDYFLGVGSGTHAQQTAAIMCAVEPVLLDEKPDGLLVVGDVNSTLACSLTAAKLGVPVIHVEAGLRSRDRSMPEEINRIVTDSLSDLLFATSEDARNNLLAENRPAENIHVVGNIMIDALCSVEPQIKASSIVNTIGMKDYLLLTLHRPENVDNKDQFERVIDTMITLSQSRPVLWPMHPRAKAKLSEFGLLSRIEQASAIHIRPPLGYIETLALMKNAAAVITDSGGIQEETTYLGAPCFTVRKNTERPETITMGTNQLSTPQSLLGDLQRLFENGPPPSTIPPLWDGHTAQRITQVLESYFR